MSGSVEATGSEETSDVSLRESLAMLFDKLLNGHRRSSAYRRDESVHAREDTVVMIDRDFAYVSRSPAHALDYRGIALTLDDLQLGLAGPFQHENAAIAMATIEALRAQGWKIGADAIRAGLANVYWPGRFDIVPGDESDVGIVNAIVNLGRALHLDIVAEGVETEAQRNFLRGTGCEQYQGFLFAPALDSVSFEARLKPDASPFEHGD